MRRASDGNIRYLNMKNLSRQQRRDLALKLNILDSRVAKTHLLIDHYRRRRNNSIRRMQMLQVQQFHLASIMIQASRESHVSQITELYLY